MKIYCTPCGKNPIATFSLSSEEYEKLFLYLCGKVRNSTLDPETVYRKEELGWILIKSEKEGET